MSDNVSTHASNIFFGLCSAHSESIFLVRPTLYFKIQPRSRKARNNLNVGMT